MLETREVMETAVKALSDKKAQKIDVLRTNDLTIIADYFVICTATSTTHIKSVTDEVEKQLEEKGERPLRKEGYRSGGWIIMDYSTVIVHVFLEETREFYALERLWGDAEKIDVSALTGPC